ncbi:acyltransferase [Patescibacteria group bacterium]
MNLIKEVGFQRIIKYLVFGLWDFVFRLLPYSPLRILWLRLFGAKIGFNCFIDRITFFNFERTGLRGLKIGQDCYLGPQVVLDLAGKITLENQVTVSAQSVILSHHSIGFNHHPLLKHYPKKTHHTIIKSGSALGVNSTILPGITIGSNSLVAAGAVVTKSVPSHKMVAGVPAEVKKSLK